MITYDVIHELRLQAEGKDEYRVVLEWVNENPEKALIVVLENLDLLLDSLSTDKVKRGNKLIIAINLINKLMKIEDEDNEE